MEFLLLLPVLPRRRNCCPSPAVASRCRRSRPGSYYHCGLRLELEWAQLFGLFVLVTIQFLSTKDVFAAGPDGSVIWCSKDAYLSTRGTFLRL